MLIKLTNSQNKSEFWMRADQVRTIERNPQNLLIVVVSTIIMTPQGFLSYEVMESMEEIAAAVSRVMGKPLGEAGH